MSSLGSCVSEPKNRKALLLMHRNCASVLSEGCLQLQKCGRGEEISWRQLEKGESVRWTVPLQPARKRGTTSYVSEPPALFSVLAGCSSQSQLQFKLVFQRSKRKWPRWGLICITEIERHLWGQEKKDLRKGWVSLPCSSLWTCWSSDRFRTGVLEQTHVSCQLT